MDYPIFVQNINVKDPQVLADPVSKKYYMYAPFFPCGEAPTERKGTGASICAICSEDLVNWSNPYVVFDQNDFWADDYATPAGFYHNGKYYLLVSAAAPGKLRHIVALVADTPDGPFVPVGGNLTPPSWQCLDGTLYRDLQGGLWLVFAHDWVQVYDGQIAAIRVEEDLSGYIGDPMILFRGSEASWGDDFMWNSYEGGGGSARCPIPYRMADGSLIMLWENCTPYGFAIGVAKSETGEICGPWKQVEKPVYCLDGGHGTLFNRLEDGMLMMNVYSPGRKGLNNVEPGPRVLMFEMEEVYYGVIEVVNEFTGNWRRNIGGHALAYRNTPTDDIPTYSKLGNYAGFFGRRRGVSWGMAPPTKYTKGKIVAKRV